MGRWRSRSAVEKAPGLGNFVFGYFAEQGGPVNYMNRILALAMEPGGQFVKTLARSIELGQPHLRTGLGQYRLVFAIAPRQHLEIASRRAACPAGAVPQRRAILRRAAIDQGGHAPVKQQPVHTTRQVREIKGHRADKGFIRFDGGFLESPQIPAPPLDAGLKSAERLEHAMRL